jgi:hypothetical protein
MLLRSWKANQAGGNAHRAAEPPVGPAALTFNPQLSLSFSSSIDPPAGLPVRMAAKAAPLACRAQERHQLARDSQLGFKLVTEGGVV